MVAASNLMQNNIRDQQREAERLEYELDSLKESIAKSNTKLTDVRTLVDIYVVCTIILHTDFLDSPHTL